MSTMRRIMLLFLFHLFISLSAANRYYDCSATLGNYTADSPYKANLEQLLSNLASNKEIDYGFYNLSTGREPDQVNLIALCRGDLTISDCRRCLNSSIQQIKQLCPGQKEAILWYDTCMLRYTNRSIFNTMEEDPGHFDCDPINATNPRIVWNTLGKLLSDLQIQASKGDSRRMFATGEANVAVPSSTKVYGLVQCTPDLSEIDCFNCLHSTIGYLQKHCYGRQGASDVEPSCNVMFGMNRFYGFENSPPPTAPIVVPSASGDRVGGGSKKNDKYIADIIGGIAGLLVMLLLAIGVIVYWRKKQILTQKADKADMNEINSAESLQFDFSKIRAATNNFSIDKKLGQGGFGVVYKGELENGQEIAIKRLSETSGQGIGEFKTEVVLVAKLQHRNLVKLLGFCLSGKEKILVYEYLPNSSLDKFLSDPDKRVSLDWETRFKIISGIAKGLLYLHEDSRLKIIHRDLKSSNILLDQGMNPKISDFGLAKLFGVDQTQDDTNRIVGTYGYMAPEYAFAGHFSVKSDVYSFGIIVLEIVSGQKNRFFSRPQEEEALQFRAWNFWNDGVPLELVDPCLSKNYSSEEVNKCIQIGLLCIQDNAAKRPNMAFVVAALSGQSVTLPQPLPPNFLTSSTATSTSVIFTSGFGSTSLPTSDYFNSHSSHNKLLDDESRYTATEDITEIIPR